MLDIGTFSFPGMIHSQAMHFAHVKVTGASAPIQTLFVSDKILPDLVTEFVVPGSRPTTRLKANKGYFVVSSRDAVDGWVPPGKFVYFVVTPDAQLEVDISTSATGKPVRGGSQILDESAFQFGMSVGGRPE